MSNLTCLGFRANRLGSEQANFNILVDWFQMQEAVNMNDCDKAVPIRVLSLTCFIQNPVTVTMSLEMARSMYIVGLFVVLEFVVSGICSRHASS